MSNHTKLLQKFPNLKKIVELLEAHYISNHGPFFSESASHPYLSVRRAKVIHDNVWGTVRFSWQELALIDSPIMQRLRDIHQTGLAFHVYPSSRHSRFEHSLGAAAIASRVFDSIVVKCRKELRDIMRACFSGDDPDFRISQVRQELRLAALLHDTGHSMFSHTSELVYGDLDLLRNATEELNELSGKKKGAGEAISFCIALTPSVKRIIDRASDKVFGEETSEDYVGRICMTSVALLIIGRSRHPFLQFLGDIVSSGFDADKLDYLLRDAQAAGLPLRYDVDRYLYDVKLQKEFMSDDEDSLISLYNSLNEVEIQRMEPNSLINYPYFETYRLRLSKRSMNVIEQIVINKMMLFSYIYHHGKVRAIEGILEKLLRRCEYNWRQESLTEEDIFLKYMEMSDSSLTKFNFSNDKMDKLYDDYVYRIQNRLVPREVYSISGPSASLAQRDRVGDFLLKLNYPDTGEEFLKSFENQIGVELVMLNSDRWSDAEEALISSGVWVDAPKPPKFEDVDVMIGGNKMGMDGVRVDQLFPIKQWTDAYQHYRYKVRIFSFSEFIEDVKVAAKIAMTKHLGVEADEFYDQIERRR